MAGTGVWGKLLASSGRVGKSTFVQTCALGIFYTSEGRSLVHLVRTLVKLRRNNPQFSRGDHYFYNNYAIYQSRNIMLFSRTYEGVFSLVALNFGAQDHDSLFQIPI